MIEAYTPSGRFMRPRSVQGDAIPAEAVWLDLLNPTADDVSAVERLCGIDVPTRRKWTRSRSRAGSIPKTAPTS